MGKFNYDTRVREVLRDQRAVDLVEEYAQGITNHPLVGVVKMFTLRQAFSYREAIKNYLNLTDGEIDVFIERLFSIE
ncbi:MAG: hypothetical protein LBT20_01210 [Clostridiales bacterium]|jgi:hypothetical protein|nr:hypothetical protein [Clostridiales bacterium]